MKNEIFFQNLSQNRSLIQELATELSNDFVIARFLYRETTHQAMMNKAFLNKETFKEWLITTVKRIYYKISQNEYSTKN